MALVTEHNQRAQFTARVARIQHGGSTTLGHQHAGMNADGSSHIYGKPVKAKSYKRGRNAILGALMAFGIGIGAAWGGETLVAVLKDIDSPELAQVLLELSEVGALTHLPLLAAVMLTLVGIIIMGLRGRAVFITAAMGIFALPILRGAEIDALMLASLAVDQVAPFLPEGLRL